MRTRGLACICDRCVGLAQEAIDAAGPDDKVLRFRPAPRHIAEQETAEEAIELAFETAFDGERPVEERCEAFEDGRNLLPSMHEVAARHPEAHTMDVVVDAIRFIADDDAEVHFVLLVSTFGPSGLHRTGHAVRVGDQWKVARTTWCALARMAGVDCPPQDQSDR